MNLKLLKIARMFRLITKEKYNEKRQIEIVKKSPFFDEKWYLEQNMDVKASGTNAAKHYVKYGWKEGRNPSPEFDTNDYKLKHSELIEKDWCPLFHYYLQRRAEKRSVKKASNNIGKPLSVPSNKKADYLAICAIMRNEGPYLKEWIEYHKIVGVERFYLYDNESTDNTKEVLKPYIDSGLVIYTYAPGNKKDGFQSKTYNDCISKYKNDTWWLALIDIDEFLVPTKENTVTDFLRKREQYPGIVINWLMFDSNGHIEKPVGGVLENYTRIHFETDHYENFMVKSIVNPREISSAGGHFHFYKHNQSHVNEQGRILPPYLPDNLTSCHLEDEIRINHYWTKSYEEFSIKAKRPRCNGQPLVITEERWNYPTYRYDYKIWKFVAQMPGHVRDEEYQRYKKYEKLNFEIEKKYSKALRISDFVDEKWYFKKYSDAQKSGYSALDHYHYIGWKKGYNPSKKFDTQFYLNTYLDVKKAEIDPLSHYVFNGYKEGRKPLVQITNSDYKIIEKSVLFDKKWYLKTYPDVKKAKIDPIEHYMKLGWMEGRNPSPRFDTKFYLNTYPDIASSNICPLLHYEKYGKAEFRVPSPDQNFSAYFCYKKPSVVNKILSFFRKPIKFSIIVASYNYEKYISQTLDSLLAQTYKNFEIIVVDDGSKDDSVKLINKYVRKYNNVFLYQHHKNINKGLSKTLQLGLSKASGDFICFCESDDYWSKDHLEEVNKLIRDFPNAKIISNNVELFGNVTEEIQMYVNVVNSRLHSNVNRINVHEIKSNPIVSFSAVAVKKDVLQKCDFNSFVIPAWLDWWLWRQILITMPLYYIPKKITYFRIHDSYNSKEKNAVYMLKYEKFLKESNKLILSLLNREYWVKQYYKHKKKSNIKNVQIIENSKFFDENYYLSTCEESLFSSNAAQHYLEVGWMKGKNPSLLFSTNHYLKFYQDITEAKMNPLLHYEQNGRKEGRLVFPVQSNEVRYKAYKHIDNKKASVLLVTHLLNYTGAPMLLLNVAKVFQLMGYKVILLSPEDGELKEEFLKIGVDVIIDGNSYVEENAYKKYQKMGIKFCLFNTYLTFLSYNYFSSHIPSIWWIHDNLLPSQVSQTLKCILKNSKDIYVPSELTKSYISKYNSDIKLLTYPIQDSVKEIVQPKKSKDILQIAIIAAIQPRKGHDIAVKAIKSLPAEFREKVNFIFIGEESVIDYCQSLKKELIDVKEVSFLPVVKERNKYHQIYEEIDVLLCPSREDPYPLVVIDALMHGCPVICSDHVGQKDIIKTTQSGFVFENENYQELAEKICYLLGHKENISELSKNARQAYLQFFDYESCALELKKIVEDKCRG